MVGRAWLGCPAPGVVVLVVLGRAQALFGSTSRLSRAAGGQRVCKQYPAPPPLTGTFPSSSLSPGQYNCSKKSWQPLMACQQPPSLPRQRPGKGHPLPATECAAIQSMSQAATAAGAMTTTRKTTTTTRGTASQPRRRVPPHKESHRHNENILCHYDSPLISAFLQCLKH